MTSRSKVATVAALVIANIFCFLWFRVRRPELPTSMQQLDPLDKLTSDEREQRVASSFALDSFQIEQASTESTFVSIPRARQWRDQQVVSSIIFNTEPLANSESVEQGGSQLPQHAGTNKVQFTAISVSAYQAEQTSDANVILFKVKSATRDVSLIKNGIKVPVLRLIMADRYTIDVHEDKLISLERASMMNDVATPSLVADIPVFLVPHRRLAVGETWVQIGVNPPTVPNAAPHPQVVGKVNRVVMFEGIRAAEISSTSTAYSFARGRAADKVDSVKQEEVRLAFFDLQTGEPLWYEVRTKGDSNCRAITRGCNQRFATHLLRTPGK